MKKALSLTLLFSLALIFTGCQAGFNRSEKKPNPEMAMEYVHNHIIVDGHIDTPSAVYSNPTDISKKTKNNFDYVKAKKGGLNAGFMSIYIPSSLGTQKARARADSLISIVKNIAQKHPDKFAVATSPKEIKKQFEKGLISLAMGMENASPLGKNLDKIEYYYNRGVRYITLAHAQDNQFSDSSYDTADDSGLTKLGKKAVQRMNKVGMIVDVSHLSEQAFFDVLEVTQAPVIASHSSARAYTPGWKRNMSDKMLKALAKNGGVIMINFGSSFIIDEARKSNDAIQAHLDSLRKHAEHPLEEGYAEEYFKNHYAYATVEQVADHFDHIVNLIGIDHVGIGSDFDGVGNSLPRDLSDASELPNLILELMERGYTEAELEKITFKNVFRVWNKVEAISQTLKENPDSSSVK